MAGRLLHRLLVIACQVMELGLHLTQDELELRIQARLALHDVLLVLLLLLLPSLELIVAKLIVFLLMLPLLLLLLLRMKRRNYWTFMRGRKDAIIGHSSRPSLLVH